MAVFELFHAEGLDRHTNVLLFTTGIREAKVDELDFLFLDQLQYVLGCHNRLS